MRLRDKTSAIVNATIAALGSVVAVVAVCAIVALWVLVGILQGFTQPWLDILHAVAGATTLLMVFMLRHSESRDMRAMLVKLDELVASVEGTNEDVIGIERADLHEQEEAESKIPSQ